MKIRGAFTETKHVDFEVGAWDVFYALQEQAYKAAGIADVGAYVSKDGTKIMYEEEIVTSHRSYYEEVLIEKPTEVQLALVKQFAVLREILQALDL